MNFQLFSGFRNNIATIDPLKIFPRNSFSSVISQRKIWRMADVKKSNTNIATNIAIERKKFQKFMKYHYLCFQTLRKADKAET